MKVLVSQDLCISCGLCEALCVEVFSMNNDGKASTSTSEIPKKFEETIQDAANNCPVGAILIK